MTRTHATALAIAFSSSMLLPISPIAAQSLALEEVVVTARKREESLQDVPVAVSAFNTEAMESMGIRNMRDIEGLVPGLNLGGGGNGVKGDGNAYIRGVGQRETRVTIDSGVGIYLDGVYIARASGALLDAVDIENIQVLRGPQGTLFGKNTTGGAILYTSVKPKEEFAGTVRGTLGNFDHEDISVSVNVPLIDDILLSRWTIASVQRDGHIKNAFDGRDYSDENRKLAIGQVRWLAKDSLTVDLNLNFTRTRQNPIGQKCVWLGDELAEAGFTSPGSLEGLYDAFSPVSVEETCKRSGEGLPIDRFQGEQNNNSTVFNADSYDVDTAMLATTITWEIDDQLIVKSITAYRNTEQLADEQLDGMEAVIIGRVAGVHNDTDQYSQELQLIGAGLDDRLNYTLGVYGFLEETNDDWLQDFAGFVEHTISPNTMMLARSNLTERETENTAFAGFAQLDYSFRENLILTLGLRYTWEERKTNYRESSVYLPSIGNGDYLGALDTIYSANVVHRFSEPGARPADTWLYGFDPDGPDGAPFEIGAFGQLSDSRSDSDWNPMASVKYLVPDNVLDTLHLEEGMLYATYATGFRSGGISVGNGDFDGDGIIDLENYKPEFVNMYEIGFKVDAFDRRLRTNVAAFYQDYDDIQLTTTIPDPNFGIPLPAIENAGKAEIQGLEVEFTLLPLTSLRLTGSLAYMDSEYKEYLSEIPDSNGGGQITIDRSDEPLPRAPKWSGFLAADFFIETDNWGTFIPHVLMRYVDETYGGFDRPSFEVEEAVTTPAVRFYDARLTWQLPDDRGMVALWVKNFTDKDDQSLGGVPTVGVARTTTEGYAPPRTWGVDVTYHFGSN